MTFSFNRLNCVLRASDAAHIDAVTSWLRVSARVGDITTCTNDTEFKDELQERAESSPPDFVVVVVSSDELPPHLLRYPDMKILVLTSRRKLGSLTPWLQQGACDVATLARPQQVQHALSRLIDECAMNRRVSLLATELLRSEARYATLIRNSRTPLSFWRDNELLACSPAFSAITGLDEGASTEQWLQNLRFEPDVQLGCDLDHWPAKIRARMSDSSTDTLPGKASASSACTNTESLQSIRIERETACDGSDDNEHLFSVKLVVASEIADTVVSDTAQNSHAASKKLARSAQKQPQKMASARTSKRLSAKSSSRFVKTPVRAWAKAHGKQQAAIPAQIPTLTRAVTPGLTHAATTAAAFDLTDDSATDSVSGLPAREAVINHFQHWLQVGKNTSRYIAMTIDLSTSRIGEDAKRHAPSEPDEPSNESQMVEATVSAIDRTLQDLAVYRAADRLSKTLSSNTLLGRLNDDCLVIIRELETDEAPRMLAKGIRRSLGSLGGLISSSDAVRINTVNISAHSGASAEGLVTRLENR